MGFDEQTIKEKRVIEATKKEYIGSYGKLAIICKSLGDQIIDQGDSYRNFFNYDDFWKNNEEENIASLDENLNLNSLGYYFYGLNYSCNIEIFYFENQKKIQVKYDNELVYKEINGDLDCYVPNKIWESKVEDFYKIAKPIEESKKQKDKKLKKQEFEVKKNNILSYLKSKWGI